eukprot:GHVH01010983.1.p1 GENE.GHVH01010983.1~~GHVH01010983.1.p1  ORF type:complete len:460 (-),score=76.52 GHVH01010983.1:33-1412(-)
MMEVEDKLELPAHSLSCSDDEELRDDQVSDDLGISGSASEDSDLVISSDAEDGDVEEPQEAKDEEIAFAGDLKQVKQRIDHAVTILSNWKLAKDDKRLQEIIQGKKRKDVVEQLQDDCSIYYGWNSDACQYFAQLFKPSELVEWFEANEAPRPITARVNTLKVKRKDLIASLVTRGVSAKPLPWSKHGLTITQSTVAPGATAEYLAGFYMLQSSSSMVPVCALGALPGESIVDMASAPGGKTTHIGQLMKNKGILYANELSAERMSCLQGNIYRMAIRNAVTLNLDGCHLPKVLGRNTMDRILLDAPCTGTGIAAKDPKVKAKRGLNDFRDAGQLQKRLLKAAIELANPNTAGVIVYSTCSVSVEENEAVVDYALKNFPVKLVPFEPAGIGSPALSAYRGNNFHPSMSLARRFYPHRDDMDGFFVAKFQKTGLTEIRHNKRRGEDTLPASAKKIRQLTK